MIRSLLAKPRERREASVFVIEGVRLVEAALDSGWQVKDVLYSEKLSPRGMQIVQRIESAGAPVECVSEDVMTWLSDTQAPQGLLAVISMRSLPVPQRLDFTVIADDVRDPGNLGTLMRTAAAAGAGAFVCTPGTTDPFSPKVLRSGMGAHFSLPIYEMDWDALRRLLHENPNGVRSRLYLAEMESGEACWDTDLTQPLALIIGGEAEGASDAARQAADASLHIPMPGKSESLNAGIAGAVLIFEVVRQRRNEHRNPPSKG
jgi:TrmH family RNA methyltransferase